MKVEWKKEISNLNELLLLEINERVKDYLSYQGRLSETTIETLKIDKESLEKFKSSNRSVTLAVNLSKKIDYLLKNVKK